MKYLIFYMSVILNVAAIVVYPLCDPDEARGLNGIIINPRTYTFKSTKNYAYAPVFFDCKPGEILEVSKLISVEVLSKHVRLINNGKNCYANSLFQCLYNIESVRTYFTSLENRNNEYFDIIKNILDHMKHKCFDMSGILGYLIDKFQNKDFIKDTRNCPIQFFEILITKLIFDDESFFYSRNKIEDIETNDIFKLFLFEDKLTPKEDKDSKYDPKNSFRYRLYILHIQEDNTSFQDSINLYFKNYINCIHIPQIVIINFYNHDSTETKNYKIEKNIDINGVKYVFKSCILYTKILGVPHFFSLVYENDNFIILDCSGTYKVYSANFDIKIKNIYSCFYERVNITFLGSFSIPIVRCNII